ncbi:hypothetical protein F5Y18DRAFT_430183 [Xylariaceae sp. FL1019]|nr:hypothetical protein F5Y18DRAFT_430183 [Xylariaceae sp. FL1019]
MASFFTDKNISYFTIPVALILALYPRSYAASGPTEKVFDPSNPRTLSTGLANSDIDKKASTVAKVLRAESAVANGIEGLPLFAAAVVAGNTAGLSTLTLNAASVGYLASRVFYNYVYITLQENRKWASIRTPVWFTGVAAIMTLFVKAGLKA